MKNAGTKSIAVSAVVFLVLCSGATRSSVAGPAELRLYVLDCGHASFKDMGGFSDTGEYDGKAGEIAVPCFLIRHPRSA